MRIIEASEKTIAQRGEKVRKLLRPISIRQGGPAWERKSTSYKSIIGTHDGSRISSDFQTWRFSTVQPNINALYYEIWESAPSRKGTYFLVKAYLHLYKTSNFEPVEKELLLLHCDPSDPDNSHHAKYKQGPHVHITVADQPIPRSHIALCLINLDEVLDTLESLTSAMEQFVLMIKEQFLDLH